MQYQIMSSTLRRLAQHPDWLELLLGEQGERLREGWRADFMTGWRPVSHWEEFSKWTQTDWQRVIEMHPAQRGADGAQALEAMAGCPSSFGGTAGGI